MRKIVGACRRHAVSQAARNPDITVKMLTALRLVERLTRMIPDFSPTPQDVDAVVAMLVIGPTFLS
jgi:hypothetical protein